MTETTYRVEALCDWDREWHGLSVHKTYPEALDELKRCSARIDFQGGKITGWLRLRIVKRFTQEAILYVEDPKGEKS